MRFATAGLGALLFFCGIAVGIVADRKAHGPIAAPKPATNAPNEALPLKSPVRAAAPLPSIATNSSLAEVQTALRTALAQPDMGRRFEAIQKAVKSLRAADVAEAYQLAKTIVNLDSRNTYIQALMERWGEVDPAAAIKEAQALHGPGQRV